MTYMLQMTYSNSFLWNCLYFDPNDTDIFKDLIDNKAVFVQVIAF